MDNVSINIYYERVGKESEVYKNSLFIIENIPNKKNYFHFLNPVIKINLVSNKMRIIIIRRKIKRFSIIYNL